MDVGVKEEREYGQRRLRRVEERVKREKCERMRVQIGQTTFLFVCRYASQSCERETLGCTDRQLYVSPSVGTCREGKGSFTSVCCLRYVDRST